MSCLSYTDMAALTPEAGVCAHQNHRLRPYLTLLLNISQCYHRIRGFHKLQLVVIVTDTRGTNGPGWLTKVKESSVRIRGGIEHVLVMQVTRGEVMMRLKIPNECSM